VSLTPHATTILPRSGPCSRQACPSTLSGSTELPTALGRLSRERSICTASILEYDPPLEESDADFRATPLGLGNARFPKRLALPHR
jgi:hypothetical protein